MGDAIKRTKAMAAVSYGLVVVGSGVVRRKEASKRRRSCVAPKLCGENDPQHHSDTSPCISAMGVLGQLYNAAGASWG